MSLLSVRSVGKVYRHVEVDVRILSAISFDANEGEVLAIRGSNGCGKTTLLNLIAGLDAPTSGAIERSDRCHVSATGYVFQNFSSSLLPWLTLRENLLLPLRFQGLTRHEQETKLSQLTRHYAINQLPLDNLPGEASGGQKQRLCIARAALCASAIVLMDEPYSALDDEGREDLLHLIEVLRTDERRLVIVVVHDLDDAILTADRIMVLTAKPTSIALQVVTDLARPRESSMKASLPFNHLRSLVLGGPYAIAQR